MFLVYIVLIPTAVAIGFVCILTQIPTSSFYTGFKGFWELGSVFIFLTSILFGASKRTPSSRNGKILLTVLGGFISLANIVSVFSAGSIGKQESILGIGKSYLFILFSTLLFSYVVTMKLKDKNTKPIV
ncbi:hypothetical protein [Pelagicoccus albus]|uniref:Uncharacterized protein n=1 Tax=Pelagicoccus albus TaxID=415222 RepID=A0A7X1B645_9BACT|nr:hypothetical protein [Pelagicoccus albus]MBC2606297.1 hypothetical protein [Pelagicoccus albus]